MEMPALIASRRLSTKERTFVHLMVQNASPSEAAEKAGYPPLSGETLFSDPFIKRAISNSIGYRERRLSMTQDWVMAEYKELFDETKEQGPKAFQVREKVLNNIGKEVGLFNPAQKIELITDDDIHRLSDADLERIASGSNSQQTQISA